MEGNNLEKKEWHKNGEVVFNEKCEALLDIPFENLELSRVQDFATERGLSLKKEFHVTLIGGDASKQILQALNALPENDRSEMKQQMERTLESFNWTPIFKDQFYYLRREYNDPDPTDPQKTIPEIRETIIQLVDLPQIAQWHSELERLLQIESIQALPHVTVFSTSTREDKKQRGIGIYSENDLRISNAILI